ncbi:MAG: PIN domain-containing protein [Defluviitaleaceae bacterium]|nr:PIN domain-containing protein [Defluviitaleaceae bacterium]
MNHYILDACALLAVLNKEDGAEPVRDILDQAKSSTAMVNMNIVNLLEVYYGVFREYGKEIADNILYNVKSSGIVIIETISENVFAEAGRLKATYKISIADSFALAEASVSGALLLTSDHHELDAVEKVEDIKFYWIR